MEGGSYKGGGKVLFKKILREVQISTRAFDCERGGQIFSFFLNGWRSFIVWGSYKGEGGNFF